MFYSVNGNYSYHLSGKKVCYAVDTMSTLAEKSLALHRQYQGKISVVPAVPIENRDDLALAYTPRVTAACEAIVANPVVADAVAGALLRVSQ